MRKILTLLFSIICITSFSQDLLKSRKTSYYTYIFKITDKEAEKIYKEDLWEVDSTFFHTLIDSIPTDNIFDLNLLPGHYLKAYTNKDILKIDITTIQDFDIRILNNNSDLCVQVYDSIGNIISDAIVKVRNKKLRFDKKSQVYKHKKSNKRGILKVKYKDQSAFYNLQRQYKNSRFKRTGKKIVYNPPVKYVWKPVSFVIYLPIDGVKSIVRGYPFNTIWKIRDFFVNSFEKIACYFDDWYCDEDYNSKFKGYMVFNKPKYQPKDTVKFKAYIVNKKGKPCEEELSVILIKDWNTRIKLSTIKPYNRGGYSYELYLHDSLNLQLDKTYYIYLEDKVNDLISGNFKYEDYELSKNKLEIRTNDEKQFKDSKFSLFVKGTDENDLSLLDASIELLISSSKVNNYFSDYVFVPDTLWIHNTKLDVSDETEITIPDSIFPLANLEYLLSVKLTTSDNEILVENKKIGYYTYSQDIDYTVNNDSISLVYKNNGKKRSISAILVGIDKFDNEFYKKTITLPYNVAINPYFSQYKIETDSLIKFINLDNTPSLIRCLSERTKDSLHIIIDNPRKIPYNYSIYKLNNEIRRGHTQEKIVFKELVHNKKNYYVSLQYLWGGQVIEEDYEIPLNDRILNIEVNQPKIVYPGQKANMEILVTDIKGDPVPNVDLTTFGITKKFNYRPTALPDLTKERRKRELINKFSIEELNSDEVGLKLDFNHWNILAELDSIEYYKFLYPGSNIYKYTYQTKDNITQFAPFVVNDGTLQPIGVIYVDRRPVYFNWTTNAQPYSFRITNGYHRIELRTSNKSIVVDSVYFERNKKTILSLNDNLKLHNVFITESTNELSRYEKENLNKYLFAYRSNFGEKFAYIKQYDDIYLLNSNANSSEYNFKRYTPTNLAGPVFGQQTKFTLIGEFNTSFEFEPYFEYDFSPNLLKMRSVNPNSVYPEFIDSDVIEEFEDLVLTEEKINTAWGKYVDQKRYSTARYDYPTSTQQGNGGMEVELKGIENNELIPLNILLLKPDSSKFLRVYPGHIKFFNDLEEGYYRLIVFYTGSKYNLIDSLKVQANGLNFYKIEKPELFKKDNFSIEVSNLIKENIFKPFNDYSNKRRKELNRIKNIYHTEYSFVGFGRTISGYVYGKEDGLSIPGVAVTVKGSSTIGTTTDIDGYYSLEVPGSARELVFSFVGMKTEEVHVYNESVVDVNMEAEVLCMDEVVVVAYGVKTNKSASVSVAASVSNVGYTDNITGLLSGKIAGVQINQNTGTPGASPAIIIRGATGIEGSSNPLYIIDGVPYLGDPTELSTDLISNIEVLKDSSVIAIYGSRAANGVVIISTKDKSFNANKTNKINNAEVDPQFLESAFESSSIRNNFSDYAFWQPKLVTNSNGKASFNVTFPDDVTNWSTYVMAISPHKQTGQTNSEIKSYKPIMAQIALPRFLVQNDSTFAIGKTLNYTLDSINLTTNFELNDSIVFTKNQTCINSIIDSLSIHPNNEDTIRAKYYLEKPDGYFDGELREIPVFKQGLEETKGNFFVLDKDTTLNLEFNDSLGTVNLYARSDELEVIDVELKRLMNYRYLCNEQLASKLKAYLAAESIHRFKNEKKNYNTQIKRIIRKLENNQNSEGFWGWWNRSETNYWISTHVLESMLKAQRLGYKVQITESKIADKAIWKLEKDNFTGDKIRLLHLLKLLNLNFDYTRYIYKLDSINNLTTQEQFRLLELKQLCHMDYDISEVLDKMEETVFGNIYFESDRSNFLVYENELQTTLIAYRIIKQDSSMYSKYLPKIRNYLFEKRENSYWGNTFESSQIIETILPDLLVDKKISGKQQLIISGTENIEINQFPYDTTFSPSHDVTITKTGKYPIYLTTYQHCWNSEPKRKNSDFEIYSHFESNTKDLEAGKSEKLIIDVEVKKDAEYVMIEIPIPAGCSYNLKKSRHRSEVHREYYKNQVTIFSNKLIKGSYQFEIDLLPRYRGKYTLNPAKIELMYFPTFNANNELKKMNIK